MATTPGQTEPRYVVMVTVHRPTEWQMASMAAYGPFTRTEYFDFVQALPAVSTLGTSPVQSVSAYQLQPNPFIDG